jgi:hypothetical protein
LSGKLKNTYIKKKEIILFESELRISKWKARAFIIISIILKLVSLHFKVMCGTRRYYTKFGHKSFNRQHKHTSILDFRSLRRQHLLLRKMGEY